jgi:ribonuclease D
LADYEIIDRLGDLEALARDLLREDLIAVDTEADSFYHYFDKTCLVQIATRKSCYLIDPLALGGPAELAPLGPVFESPKIRKVFHAAEYDIFVLKRDCGFTFSNLFDTMVSAQLLGYPSIGLAALIQHHFGINVPKDEQRSDWSRRPLTDKQLKYAAGDVLYLIRLAQKLEKALEQADRLSWAQEEFRALTLRRWPDREFDTHGHLRIKGARKLDARTAEVLRELYLMRDERAREIDRPTFKVLGNRTLLELAESKPKRLADLEGVKGITELILRRMGKDILEAVKRGKGAARSPAPKQVSNGRKRVDRKTERTVNRLKRWRATRAQELNLDPGVLCPNSSLEAIAWKNPETADALAEIPELKGWLARAFGEEIVGIVGRDDAPGEAGEGSETAGETGAERAEREREQERRGAERPSSASGSGADLELRGDRNAASRGGGTPGSSSRRKKRRRRKKKRGPAGSDSSGGGH